MSVDRLLTDVLHLYQDVHDDARTEQIYATTATLLVNLSNPLNISLLTSHLLTAPALWRRSGCDPLRVCYRILAIFNTAGTYVKRNESGAGPAGGGNGLRAEPWARAVAAGADAQSQRWQHVLVLAGLLMGLTAGTDEEAPSAPLARRLRNTIEGAVVTAATRALQPSPDRGDGDGDRLAARATALALTYVFPLLSGPSQSRLPCTALIPACADAIVAEDGLEDAVWIRAIDGDFQKHGDKFSWSADTPSFQLLGRVEQRPLVSALGPLSRLLGYAIRHSRDTGPVVKALDDLVAFTGRLLLHWQASNLSGLEISEEGRFLDPETLRTTWSALWQLLRKVMYGVVAVLQHIVARTLLDPRLGNHAVAPVVASKALHILRNLYFISSYKGNDAFQVYGFTHLTSIDTIARYPQACVAFLRETMSSNPSAIPTHPLARTLDLFYLNTAEHLPLEMPSEACDALIVQPATAYLSYTAAPLSPRMVELFEAAHSAVLSVFSCPQNSSMAADLAPFYAESLFRSFPSHMSPRQFRLAFKSTMQVLSPPFPVSASHPDLAETLLEMVRLRFASAGTALLPPRPGAFAAAGGLPRPNEEPISEQSTLVLTLVDSLPYLPLVMVEEWMTMAALSIHDISDSMLRQVVQKRFWDILVSGELDVERSAIAVAWWGTRGGREAVLYGAGQLAPGTQQQFLMSVASPGSGESKL
ncbi:hypothetical protein P8C59_004880 [Phyllachora maydis]|uniref:Peroxisomal membrane protein PEX17 n=3 Tax=Phyllachora maydis TaxID=1825666 RepID=A0AAD9MBQ8_9PEZI|nr:hypothetical protein P8C59_004880 [Phyllachora maydis]